MKARRKWFSKKKKTPTQQPLNSRDNYLCVIITLSPKQEEKNLMGKLNKKMLKNHPKNGGVKMLMTKRHIRTRSNDQHRLLLLTEVKKIRNIAIQSAWKKYKLH